MLAIVSILACILMPVALAAKREANRSVCSSNLKQAYYAMTAYQQDYDDYYPPVNYQPGPVTPDPKTDRTWVQLLLPYANSLAIFHCPSDNGRRDSSDGTFDADLVPTDTYQRYYQASLRSDIGFNYAYLSPIAEINGTWQSVPRTGSSVAEPSKTLLYVDSIWSRGPFGNPVGGGSWLVTPPCRYEESDSGARVDTFAVSQANRVYLDAQYGWSSDPNSGVLYGHAWPWHSGKMNVAHADGSVVGVTAHDLGEGCNVQPSFNGLITSNRYMWAAQLY